MTKTLTLLMAFVALATVVSCGKDDPNPENLTIDETNLAPLILNAYIIDDGYNPVRAEGTPNTKYTKFYLTDGEFTFTTEGEIAEYTYGDLELKIYIDVETEGTEFTIGEYDMYEYCSGNQPTRGVTVNASWFDGEFDYYYGHDGGSVTITGTDNTYTLSFDGLMNDYSGVSRIEGCASYPNVEISGKIRKNFTPISEEVYYNWYYGLQ
jgi:hypothetical protein